MNPPLPFGPASHPVMAPEITRLVSPSPRPLAFSCHLQCLGSRGAFLPIQRCPENQTLPPSESHWFKAWALFYRVNLRETRHTRQAGFHHLETLESLGEFPDALKPQSPSSSVEDKVLPLMVAGRMKSWRQSVQGSLGTT